VVEDFRLLSLADGRPRQYESDLVVVEAERVMARQTVSVNHPMHFRGWTFYQASYERAGEAQLARVEIVDRLSGVRTAHRILAEQAITLDDGVQFGVIAGELDHAGNGPALHLARIEDGIETDFWVFAGRPGYDARNREDRWSVDFAGFEPVYLTGILVARDPGADIVFAGCVLLALGLAQAFYSSHRRIWARVEATGTVLAGSAHRNPEAFGREFAALESRLREPSA
jgi:cytochrome c biogenesis protein